MTDSIKLLQSIPNSNRARPNFFNGRILTGEMLRQAQDTRTKEQKLLGKALGVGIVEG